jgi:branched-chain amino acid aminotransferase
MAQAETGVVKTWVRSSKHMDKSALWYVDGCWVHPDEAMLSINDVAVLRGYSAFESLRTYHRRPFHLEEHLERLYRSAQLIELDIPYSRHAITEIIHKVIARNAYVHASIRILVTGGESDDGVMPSGKSVLAVLITPLAERDMERFARGIKVITSHLERVTPGAKTANYVAAIRSLKKAARHHASDALFVNEQGHVLEGTRSNFFVFRGDVLITPREGILFGVTRNTVLQLVQGRFALEERPVLLEDLPLIDEAFLTSSSKEITPVVQIDDLVIGGGKPGPRTYELEQRFIDMVEQGAF